MKIPRICWIALLLVACSLGATSCQNSAKKPLSAQPPVNAAPAIADKSANVSKPSAVIAPQAKAKSEPPADLISNPNNIPNDPTPVAPKGDSVDAIVAQADKEYETGQENYAADNPEAAKDNFDRALSLLEQAPGGISSDPRLQAELDKIVAGIHSIEMVAGKRGDSLLEQKSEPAPIDEANESTFPVDPNIKAKAAQEITEIHSDLPLVLNDTVAGYINFYSSRGHDVLERALNRAGQYREMIQRILKEEGVPQDLIYLAEAESGFHPLALSHAGARGMWQFIASRASGYGLQRNWWVDERQDPEKSTRAAARHLRDLYKQFGDWYLAMAAYNSGPLTVQQAVKRTGYADFWELYRRGVLPPETRNYVPIIVAVAIMAKNPSEYGLNNIAPDQPLEMDRVKINYAVDLRLVAQCVDSPVAMLQELNPSLLRMITPKTGEFELHLPVGSTEKYQTAIAAIPRDSRLWWRYHTVGANDTLASIARTYRTTPKAIVQVNHLDGSRVEEDAKLIIPVAAGRRPMNEEGTTYSRHLTRYRVRRGDTVASVADNFGLPAQQIRRWNRLRGNSLRPGRVLLIHLPVSLESKSASRGATSKSKAHGRMQAESSAGVVRHKVRRGETLTSIAGSYNMSVDELRRSNAKAASNLRAGDVLVIKQAR